MNHASPQLLATPLFKCRERTTERADLLDRLREANESIDRVRAEDDRLRLAGRQAERLALYRSTGDAAFRRFDALRERFEDRGWRFTADELDYIDSCRPRRNFNPGGPDEVVA